MLTGFSQIGETLRNARRAKQMSQAKLAQKLGVTQTTISRAEAGGDLKLATLVEIARALDLEPLLAPRSLIPAIRNIVGDSLGHRRSVIYSGDGDELYDEGSGVGARLTHNDLKPRNVKISSATRALRNRAAHAPDYRNAADEQPHKKNDQ